MKKLFAISSLFTLLFLSCKKVEKITSETPQNIAATEKKDNLFVTDSVKINDSLQLSKMVTGAFQSQALVFPNITNKTLLDSIYSVENIKLNEYSKTNLLAELNVQKQAFYNETKESLKDWEPDSKRTFTQNSYMKLFSTLNNFMILQYKSDGYTGGAHGYYNEIYKVFDVKTNKTLQLSDVLKVRDSNIWSRILMDNFLKNDLEKGQAEMLLIEEIPLNNNFYFDLENLYFLYNQYEITAYAAGPVLIEVPLSEIKPFLTSEFKLNLKL